VVTGGAGYTAFSNSQTETPVGFSPSNQSLAEASQAQNNPGTTDIPAQSVGVPDTTWLTSGVLSGSLEGRPTGQVYGPMAATSASGFDSDLTGGPRPHPVAMGRNA
jgi:hypothetical protein